MYPQPKHDADNHRRVMHGHMQGCRAGAGKGQGGETLRSGMGRGFRKSGYQLKHCIIRRTESFWQIDRRQFILWLSSCRVGCHLRELPVASKVGLHFLWS